MQSPHLILVLGEKKIRPFVFYGRLEVLNFSTFQKKSAAFLKLFYLSFAFLQKIKSVEFREFSGERGCHEKGMLPSFHKRAMLGGGGN